MVSPPHAEAVTRRSGSCVSFSFLVARPFTPSACNSRARARPSKCTPCTLHMSTVYPAKRRWCPESVTSFNPFKPVAGQGDCKQRPRVTSMAINEWVDDYIEVLASPLLEQETTQQPEIKQRRKAYAEARFILAWCIAQQHRIAAVKVSSTPAAEALTAAVLLDAVRRCAANNHKRRRGEYGQAGVHYLLCKPNT